jgi:hypothetical protein
MLATSKPPHRFPLIAESAPVFDPFAVTNTFIAFGLEVTFAMEHLSALGVKRIVQVSQLSRRKTLLWELEQASGANDSMKTYQCPCSCMAISY